MRRINILVLVLGLAAAAPGCATLEHLRQIVQAPRFEEVPDQPAELRLLSPRVGLPIGGAGVRLWTKVTNPNPFGFTLSTLQGTLFLEESRASSVDFPLGLPLGGRAETIIPIDLQISFSDIPGLASVIQRAIGRQPLAYRLEGTIGVDAGQFGEPTFGPMTLLRGELTAGNRQQAAYVGRGF